MTQEFISHMKHNWPLAIVVVGLFLYIPITLITGVFYTNQGNILRSGNPKRYWQWILPLIILFFVSSVVLLGSYALSKH
jgi:hypothetical protein